MCSFQEFQTGMDVPNSFFAFTPVIEQQIVSQVTRVLFVLCSVAVHVVTGERFKNIGGVQRFGKQVAVELSDVSNCFVHTFVGCTLLLSERAHVVTRRRLENTAGLQSFRNMYLVKLSNAPKYGKIVSSLLLTRITIVF